MIAICDSLGTLEYECRRLFILKKRMIQYGTTGSVSQEREQIKESCYFRERNTVHVKSWHYEELWVKSFHWMTHVLFMITVGSKRVRQVCKRENQLEGTTVEQLKGLSWEDESDCRFSQCLQQGFPIFLDTLKYTSIRLVTSRLGHIALQCSSSSVFKYTLCFYILKFCTN